MTITALDARDEYTASASQTIFNYTFKIYASSELDVYITPSGQSADDSADLTTAYTVDPSTIGDPSGGFITLDAGTSAGDLVTIVSGIPYNRTVDYQNSGDFLPDTVDGDNDRQVSQIKQVKDLASRSLFFPNSQQNTTALSLPNPAAYQFLRWKGDLTGLENTPINDSETNTVNHYRDTATAGQTVFTTGGSYLTGLGQLSVYINGVKLAPGDEFTETSSTSFTLTTGALVGQLVDHYIGVIGIVAQDASAVAYQPATGSASDVQTALRAAEADIDALESNTINVKDYGAIGDGVTDDTAAFNAFAAAIKAAVTDYGNGTSATDTVAITFLIPPGDYSVSTVNFTEIRSARNVFITGYNANLIANTAGKTVVDCVGSRWLWFVGLTVISPSTVVAKHGIQFGNVGTEACGNNKLQFVQCLGDFSLSPYANYGSETTQLYSCRFSNESSTVASYAAYMDGEGNKIPASDYATITKTVGTAVSFTNNAHFGCQFRHLGAGSSVYLARCTGWSFDDSTYFLAFDEANVIIYSTTTSRTPDLSLGGLFETSQAPGVQDCIRFVGDATNTNLAGFAFKPSSIAAEAHIFNNTTGASVTITEADISIVSVSDPGGTLKLVNTTSGISIIGEYKSRLGAVDNFSDLTVLGGNTFVENKSLVTIPANTFGFVFDQATGGVDAHNMTVIP